jgi:hypothetical protein
MKRQFVESSNLASVGYDAVNQILEIQFKNGGIYQYYNVPNSTYNGLMNASSHGTYFDTNIKKAGYRYKKIS